MSEGASIYDKSPFCQDTQTDESQYVCAATRNLDVEINGALGAREDKYSWNSSVCNNSRRYTCPTPPSLAGIFQERSKDTGPLVAQETSRSICLFESNNVDENLPCECTGVNDTGATSEQSTMTDPSEVEDA